IDGGFHFSRRRLAHVFTSMNGRICLVTGSTHGIGLATARALAEMGATVLVHGRDGVRARAVARTLGRDTGSLNVRSVHADFAELGDLMNARVPGFLPAYERSKLANLLLVRSLARRLAGSGVSVNALHPGLVASQLFRGLPLLLRLLLLGPGRLAMISTERGARGSVYLASAPGLAGESGGYYCRCRRVAP